MIEYISGKITDLQPTEVTLDVSGVGYLLNISLTCYGLLQGKSEARLYVHESIREDAWTLYGFGDKRERSLFRLLIGVSGVGASTARVVLSSYTAPELESIIVNGDSKTLKGVKGIGAKTAERIIVDLRDKIKPGDETLLIDVPRHSEVYDEALAALTMLGFTRQNSEKALKKIFDETPTVTVEAAIKKAFSMM
ncbi:MAG: Holliday junction branch migration protein RuvA [Muribaculaceae bacterium]|nr:Holliday junction branch migration protein RuvA [Muribaculaceae bacterium]